MNKALSLKKLFSVVGLLSFVGTSAYANWNNFYTSIQKEVLKEHIVQTSSPVQSVCVREILLAQARHNIPDNILLGIGLQEAGTRRQKELVVWPWAVNAEGKGKLFDTKGSAMQWVHKQLSNGMRSIDIGCMQINLRWHPNAFSSLQEGFSPEANVDYAARLLKAHYNASGNWRIAAGRYHSKTPEKQEIYLASLQQNIRVANTQINQFRSLANLKSNIIKITKQDPKQLVQQEKSTDQNNSYWTSALSRQDVSTGHYRSIYSQVELQPILPNFNTIYSGE